MGSLFSSLFHLPSWMWVFGAGALTGWGTGVDYGRRRGLRHLGEVEYRNRWESVRAHKPW